MKQFKDVKSVDLIKALKEIYQPSGLNIRDVKSEDESQDYGACQFRLGAQKIVFRVAKITPKKIGQFVVLWKRDPSGVIKPYDVKDDIDFFVVTVQAFSRTGQFVFPKNILHAKRILAGEASEGKRAFRVYPPWDVTTNQQAKSTQAWQLDYFFELTDNLEENILNIQKRYK